MSHVTTHVLDTAAGTPAVGIPVSLHDSEGAIIAIGVTNDDGRVPSLGPDALPSGIYTIVFDTAEVSTFFPNVTVTFTLDGSRPHYHLPLLLSPFAYSTYRGS